MNKLMTHLVANYPDTEAAFAVASAMVKGGTSILEVQLAFSDPSADGPLIQNACNHVLQNNYKVEDGLKFIKRLRDAFPETTIYIMSYGSLIYTPGVDAFCKKAAEIGVNGMIIPDLPFDCDEGLTASCKKYGMENIPVAAFGMSDRRLGKMLDCNFEHIYVALRRGITGSQTTIDQETVDFINKVSSKGAKIFGGFGIAEKSQADQIAPYVDSIVAGSVFVKIIEKYVEAAGDGKIDVDALAGELEAKVKSLC